MCTRLGTDFTPMVTGYRPDQRSLLERCHDQDSDQDRHNDCYGEDECEHLNQPQHRAVVAHGRCAARHSEGQQSVSVDFSFDD